MILLKSLPLFLIIYYVDASRILAVVPTASHSHQIFFRPLWKELSRRGHEVVLITTDPMRDPTLKNLREIDISNVYDYHKTGSVEDLVKLNKIDAIKLMYKIGITMTRLFLSHPEVQQLFKDPNESFDLLIVESVLMCVKTFKHRFPNASLIYTASFDVQDDIHDMVGNPTHLTQYPSAILPFGEDMTFVQRLITNFVVRFRRIVTQYVAVPEVDKVVKELLGDEYPSVGDEVQIDMVFTNSNPLFNSVRPFTPATISLAGGLHHTSNTSLPKDLQEFLDASPKGVVYFSLGSNVKSKNIEPNTLKVILETFTQLEYSVLWKFENDELPGKPKNVKIVKWLPQQDVLRHQNVKVFITQGGLQSLEESFYSGVPVVVMPYFADQESNAKRVVQNGLGLEVNHRSLTVEDFKSAIENVAGKESFKLKVKQAADLIQDAPMKPLEKAVWWTEYVLRHKGTQHLKGPRIPFWQFYYFDVIGFISAIMLIVLFVLVKICCLVLRVLRICKTKIMKKPKTTKNKKKSKKVE